MATAIVCSQAHTLGTLKREYGFGLLRSLAYALIIIESGLIDNQKRIYIQLTRQSKRVHLAIRRSYFQASLCVAHGSASCINII